MLQAWRKCSRCKTDIMFNAKYYVCSVSTCNGQRTGYAFCSVNCWESHVPGAKHRDAAAVGMRAPTSQTANASVSSSEGTRRIVATPLALKPINVNSINTPEEILVVVSKMKAYIRARSDMNTSDDVMDSLSGILRWIADEAIENARQDGRKTVMNRDIIEFKNRLRKN